jgi:hypothetical protein
MEGAASMNHGEERGKDWLEPHTKVVMFHSKLQPAVIKGH